MLSWSLEGNNDDSGKKSRTESKSNLKNQSSEIVSYAPAIAWHLSDPMTLTNSSRVWWLDRYWSIKENKEVLMELLTFLVTNSILKAFSKNHPRSLSLVLNLMINSGPQDKRQTLDRWCTQSSNLLNWLQLKLNDKTKKRAWMSLYEPISEQPLSIQKHWTHRYGK